MKIYKLDSKGKVRVLEVTTNEGNLIQTSGLLDGKKVEHTKLCKPKNIGKVNETTEVTQSEFEAEESKRKLYPRLIILKSIVKYSSV